MSKVRLGLLDVFHDKSVVNGIFEKYNNWLEEDCSVWAIRLILVCYDCPNNTCPLAYV
jgi:hypothetical protein